MPKAVLTRLIAVGGAVVLAAFLFGCGGGSDTSGEPALPPNVVTDSDIDAQASGSPERALLEWWQSFQFGDSEQVLQRTSKSTIDKLGEHDLSEYVKSAGQGLQGVEVLGSEENGNTASVRVGLLTFQPEKGQPPPTDPTSSTPDTFEMKKEGDDWKFAATEFLEPKIEAFQAAQQEQQSTTTTSTESTTTTSTGG